MNEVAVAVLGTQNIALILAVAGCVICGVFHWMTRKEDRSDRKQDREDRAEERKETQALIRQNTDALHALRNTLSAINGKVF